MTIKQNQSYKKVLSSSRETDYQKNFVKNEELDVKRRQISQKIRKKLTFQIISPHISIQFRLERIKVDY